MATKRSSQTQQAATPNPFTQLPGLDLWRTMLDAQRERFEQMASEYERLEKERHARTMTAIDDLAKLMKSSVEYQQQLGAQWREATVDAARKGAGLVEGSN